MKDTLKTVNVLLMLKSLEDEADHNGDSNVSFDIQWKIQDIKDGDELDEN